MKEFNQPMTELDIFYVLNILINILMVVYYISVPIILFKIWQIIKKKS